MFYQDSKKVKNVNGKPTIYLKFSGAIKLGTDLS